MCIECSLLCPLLDEYADRMGVAKRTYLVVKNEYKTYALCNYSTSQHMRNPKIEDMKIKTVKDTHGWDLFLYQGKITIFEPLPLEAKPTDDTDLYLELFDGDLIWKKDVIGRYKNTAYEDACNGRFWLIYGTDYKNAQIKISRWWKRIYVRLKRQKAQKIIFNWWIPICYRLKNEQGEYRMAVRSWQKTLEL